MQQYLNPNSSITHKAKCVVSKPSRAVWLPTTRTLSRRGFNFQGNRQCQTLHCPWTERKSGRRTGLLCQQYCLISGTIQRISSSVSLPVCNSACPAYAGFCVSWLSSQLSLFWLRTESGLWRARLPRKLTCIMHSFCPLTPNCLSINLMNLM